MNLTESVLAASFSTLRNSNDTTGNIILREVMTRQERGQADGEDEDEDEETAKVRNLR